MSDWWRWSSNYKPDLTKYRPVQVVKPVVIIRPAPVPEPVKVELSEPSWTREEYEKAVVELEDLRRKLRGLGRVCGGTVRAYFRSQRKKLRSKIMKIEPLVSRIQRADALAARQAWPSIGASR